MSHLHRHIKQKDAKHLFVPHYKSLTVAKILLHCHEHHDGVFEYLPIEKEQKQLPRPWLCDLIFSVVGEPFSEWVTLKSNDRNQELIKKRDVEVELTEEIAELLRNTTHVSSKYQKSKFLNCCKPCYSSFCSLYQPSQGAPNSFLERRLPERGLTPKSKRPRPNLKQIKKFFKILLDKMSS